MSAHPPPPVPSPPSPPRMPWSPAPTGPLGRLTLDPGRVLIGLVVITIGVLYLFERADVLDAGATIGDWWPVAIIAMGAFRLMEGTHGLIGPIIVTAAGTVLLLATTDAMEGDAWAYIWPVVLVAGGLALILPPRPGRVARVQTGSDDVLSATGIFGGPTVASSSRTFRGASLTAAFGGVVCDLRSAHLAPEGAKINATAAFGGVEIRVPRGWRIAVTGTPLFGGIDDKTEHEPDLPDEAPVLRIDAFALFGGVEVTHGK